MLSQLCYTVLTAIVKGTKPGPESLRASPTISQLVQGKVTVQAVVGGWQRLSAHRWACQAAMEGEGRGASWRRLWKWPQRMHRTWTFRRVIHLLNGDNSDAEAQGIFWDLGSVWAMGELFGRRSGQGGKLGLFCGVFFFFFFFSFLGLHLPHTEVPRLGVRIGAVAASLWHSHGNAGSELHLQTCGNAGSLTHSTRPGIEPESSWLLGTFLTR